MVSFILTQAGHICWDDNDVINGKPSGAVRVSFGYMSTFEEAKVYVLYLGFPQFHVSEAVKIISKAHFLLFCCGYLI